MDLVTLLGGAGGIGLLVKSVLYYIDRERDRRALLQVLKDRDARDVEAVARGLRTLRWKDAEEPDEKPAEGTPKPPLAIESARPDAPPGGDKAA
jgi:hypothetical protein